MERDGELSRKVVLVENENVKGTISVQIFLVLFCTRPLNFISMRIQITISELLSCLCLRSTSFIKKNTEQNYCQNNMVDQYQRRRRVQQLCLAVVALTALMLGLSLGITSQQSVRRSNAAAASVVVVESSSSSSSSTYESTSSSASSTTVIASSSSSSSSYECDDESSLYNYYSSSKGGKGTGGGGKSGKTASSSSLVASTTTGTGEGAAAAKSAKSLSAVTIIEDSITIATTGSEEGDNDTNDDSVDGIGTEDDFITSDDYYNIVSLSYDYRLLLNDNYIPLAEDDNNVRRRRLGK